MEESVGSPAQSEDETPSPLTRRVFTGFMILSGAIGMLSFSLKSVEIARGILVAQTSLPMLLGDAYCAGLSFAGAMAWRGSARWLRIAAVLLVPQLFCLRIGELSYSVVVGLGLYVGAELAPFDVTFQGLWGARAVFTGVFSVPGVAVNLVALTIAVALWYAAGRPSQVRP